MGGRQTPLLSLLMIMREWMDGWWMGGQPGMGPGQAIELRQTP